MISFVIAISCLSLAFAVFLARWVLQRDIGNAKDAGDLQRDQRRRRSVHVAAEPNDHQFVGGVGRADLSPLCLCAHAESQPIRCRRWRWLFGPHYRLSWALPVP